jgi:putative CocE/NonD family hydrolase
LVALAAPPADGGHSSFTFDPQHPLPTIAANVSSLNEILPLPARVRLPTPNTFQRSIVIQGAADQVTRSDVHCEPPFGPLAARPDTLVFEPEPLTMPIEVTGPVDITLYVASDAPDTDIFAMLLDIYPPSAPWPDGYRMNITDSIMRLRYRDGMATPKLMESGQVYTVHFPLYPTSNLFDAGHRIQLLISSSSFPRFDVNPNTGEAIGRHTHIRVARNTIYHAAVYPSKVTLPLVPRSS